MSKDGVLGKNKVYLGNDMLSSLLEGRNAWEIGETELERIVSHMVGGFEC